MSKKPIVLLFFPKTGPSFLEPPFGLLALASSLTSAGFDVRIIDTRIHSYKSVCSKYSKDDILFCGISAMTGPQIHHALNISKHLRSIEFGPIVWGGIHTSIFPESISHPLIDYILRGYADHTIVNLASVLRKNEISKSDLQSIPGISFKDHSQTFIHPELPAIDLEQTSPTNWNLIDLNHYINDIFMKSSRTMYMFTSRGCSFNCSFCYKQALGNNGWQGFSSKRILEDIDLLSEQYDFDTIFFHDDNFSLSRSRMETVLRDLKERDLGYVVSANAATITEETIKLLSETGCIRLDFAIETGSPRLLRRYDKGFNHSKARKCIRLCEKYNVPIVLSFMLGHPEETRHSVFQTISFINFTRENHSNVTILDIKILTPYPNTPVFCELIEKKILTPPQTLEEWAEYYWNTSPKSDEKLKDLLLDLSFISLFAFRFKHLLNGNIFRTAAFFILHKIALFRWNHHLFRFTYEQRLLQILFKKMSHLL